MKTRLLISGHATGTGALSDGKHVAHCNIITIVGDYTSVMGDFLTNRHK